MQTLNSLYLHRGPERSFVVGIFLSLLLAGNTQAAEFIERTSATVTGGQINGDALTTSISANGRFVAFTSSASNIAPGGNGKLQIYVRERRSGAVSRISQNALGEAGNGDSTQPGLSSDGRYVVYQTMSSNLVSSDANTRSDILLHDRVTGVTQLVSATPAGVAGNGSSTVPAISADSTRVAFASQASDLVSGDTNEQRDVFLFDRIASAVQRVSTAVDGTDANAGSNNPDISANGRFVSYLSGASNLVGDDTDSRQDVFVTDVLNDTTVRANLTATGAQAGASAALSVISDDGNRVAFYGLGSGLVPNSTGRNIYVKTLSNGAIEAIDPTNFSEGADNIRINTLTIDNAGCRVGFDLIPVTDLIEGLPSLHVFNCLTGQIRSIATTEFNPGTLVADQGASGPSIDAQGRNLAFISRTATLVADDTNTTRDSFLIDTGEDCNINNPSLRRTLRDRVWALLALPCEPPPGSDTVIAIFDELDSAPGDGLNTTWALYTFNASGPMANTYEQATANTRLRPGQGFWIIQRTGTDVEITLPSGSNRVPVDALSESCTSANGCYALPLSGDRSLTSWNIVGNPLDSTVLRNSTLVTSASGPCAVTAGCTLAEAADESGANLLRPALYTYDDALDVPAYESLTGNEPINPWSGMWVNERAGAQGNAPSLHFARE